MPVKASKSSTAARRAAEARDASDDDDDAAKSVAPPGRAQGNVNGKTSRARAQKVPSDARTRARARSQRFSSCLFLIFV